MFIGFDHIGIVVRTLASGREYLSSLLGISEWTQEFYDPGIKVSVQFGRDRRKVWVRRRRVIMSGDPRFNLRDPRQGSIPL
jgi:hypothetical protein